MKRKIQMLGICLFALCVMASCTDNSKYTITFEIEGKENIVATYEWGDKIVIPEVESKEGYTFIGWNDEIPEFMPDRNLKFTAVFEDTRTEHTITYQVEGMEDIVVKYKSGETIVKPEDPIVEGYTFHGWEPSLPEIMPAENLIVKAILSIQNYTITYQVEGMEDCVVLYTKGETIVKPENPIREGYTFMGWDQELPEVMPGKDLVLKAIFTKNTYMITYKGIGVEDIVEEYEFESEIVLPEPHYRNGFLFSKWIEDVPTNMPAENLVIHAKYSMDPDYEGVLFIGHAGCYSGIMNTETAFINAAIEKGYQAIECDVKQTKDGVFVVCHDDTFNGIAIAQTNYEDLKDVPYTTTRGGISYTSTICTLERYLEICKEYDLYAVIELKYSAGINNNDQSRMPALMAEIAKMDMTNQVIFLASQYKCLEWVRNNGYDDIQCQYLVNSADSETVYNRCVEWNFDVSFNIASTNTKEWIDRYHDAGLKVSSYTFNQYQDAATLQKWIDLGVDYVTCDKLVEGDVTLPDYSEIGKLPRYTVLFMDYDGTILKETLVREGNSAAAPLNPIRTGYQFAGWDKSYSDIRADLIVYDTYSLAEYKITYQDNLILVNETSWSSKQEFIDTFYEDWFNWLSSRVGIISGLTKNGDTYTLVAGTGSNNTATFTNATDLKALNVYVVEKTIGAFVYEPIEGTNSETYVFEENSNYFLQTEPYRSKYKDLNRYFLYVIETAYSGYSKNYAQASQGRVQIFFRFHQWQQGVNIPAFDTLPKKFDVTILDDVNPIMPTIHLTYTFEESFILEEATCEGYRFVGWYLDQDCSENKKITAIEKGMTGDLLLFAKWEKIESSVLE